MSGELLTPGGGELGLPGAWDTQHELRTLLVAASHGSVEETRIRASAAAIASDARRRNVRVEEMLVSLKAEWMPLIDEQGLAWTPRVRDLTSRLITHCISAYYAPANGNGADRDS